MLNIKIGFIFSLCALFYSEFTWACSPPLNPLYGLLLENANLQFVVSSAEFNAELKKLSDLGYPITIKKIEFENGYQVTLSNGCTIYSNIRLAPPTNPGMCPMVSVAAETQCI